MFIYNLHIRSEICFPDSITMMDNIRSNRELDDKKEYYIEAINTKIANVKL